MSDLAFEYAPVGLALLENRIIQRCNMQFADTFRTQAADLVQIPISALYPSVEDYQRIGAVLQTPEAQTGVYQDERIMRRCSGGLFWCRVRGRSLSPNAPYHSGIWSFADLSIERPVVNLSPREREIAILTCKGMSAKEIGLNLGLSYRTIETHRARLLKKFSARKLPELVAKLSGMPL